MLNNDNRPLEAGKLSLQDGLTRLVEADVRRSVAV
jgi:hypothetical protein